MPQQTQSVLINRLFYWPILKQWLMPDLKVLLNIMPDTLPTSLHPEPQWSQECQPSSPSINKITARSSLKSVYLLCHSGTWQHSRTGWIWRRRTNTTHWWCHLVSLQWHQWKILKVNKKTLSRPEIAQKCHLQVPEEFQEQYIDILSKHQAPININKSDLGLAKHLMQKIHLKTKNHVQKTI